MIYSTAPPATDNQIPYDTNCFFLHDSGFHPQTQLLNNISWCSYPRHRALEPGRVQAHWACSGQVLVHCGIALNCYRVPKKIGMYVSSNKRFFNLLILDMKTSACAVISEVGFHVCSGPFVRDPHLRFFYTKAIVWNHLLIHNDAWHCLFQVSRFIANHHLTF